MTLAVLEFFATEGCAGAWLESHPWAALAAVLALPALACAVIGG